MLYLFMNFYARFPFNWNTPSGFAVNSLIIGFYLCLLTHMASCAINISIGCFMYITIFGSNILRKCADIFENNKTNENEAKILNELIDVISSHANAMEFSKR